MCVFCTYFLLLFYSCWKVGFATLNLEAGAAKVATRTKGNFTIMPCTITRLSCISSSSLPFPFISFSSSSTSFFSSPSASLSPYIMRFGRPPGPPGSPERTCRTGTGMSAYRPRPPPPPGSKIITGVKLFTSYKIVTGITRLLFFIVC